MACSVAALGCVSVNRYSHHQHRPPPSLAEPLVCLLQAHPAKILDTRKTAPGLRLLDKWAVLIGGGANHRLGLYDMLMIKDNHIAAAGGITPAVHRAQVGASSNIWWLRWCARISVCHCGPGLDVS